MQSNSLGNPPRPGPAPRACTACPEPSRRERSERAVSPPSALPWRHPEGRPFRPEACPEPSRRGSRAIGTRTRCFAALSMTAVRIAPGLRRSRSRPRPSAEFTLSAAQGLRPTRPGRVSPNAPPTSSAKGPFLIATRTYSREELSRWKERPIPFSNRNKIHFIFLPHPGADRVRSGALPYRNHACTACPERSRTERSECEANRCLH